MTKEEFIKLYNPTLNKAGNIKLVTYKTADTHPPENVWSEWKGEGKRFLIPGFRVVNATGRYAVTDKAWGETDYFEVRL